jgi:hypothetical protein
LGVKDNLIFWTLGGSSALTGSGSGVIGFEFAAVDVGEEVTERRATMTSSRSASERRGDNSMLLRGWVEVATLDDELGKPFACFAVLLAGDLRLADVGLYAGLTAGRGSSANSGELDSSYETFLRERVDLVDEDGTGESDFLEASLPFASFDAAFFPRDLDSEVASVPGLPVDCRLHGAAEATEVDMLEDK